MLSALAEREKRVEALFYTKTANAAGCYVVYFYVNGVKTPVMIDDYFPVTTYNKLAFSSGKHEEIWVPLLEKAWAKLHGSYARTVSGSSHFAFSQLVGLPGRAVKHEELKDENMKDSFWQELN